MEVTLILGLARQCVSLANMARHVHIGHATFCWVVYKHSVARIHRCKTYAFYQLLAVSVSLLVGCLLVWLLIRPDRVLLVYVGFTFIVTGALLPSLGALLLYFSYSTATHLREMGVAETFGTCKESGTRLRRMVRRLLWGVLALLATWCVACVFDVVLWSSWVSGRRAPSEAVLAGQLVSLRLIGVLDACFLGRISDAHVSFSENDHDTVSVSHWSSRQRESDGAIGSSALIRLDPGEKHRSLAKVFATTWNMGVRSGAGVDELLPLWIPPGYDLYIIAMQECTCIRIVRAAIHRHLGRWVSQPAWVRDRRCITSPNIGVVVGPHEYVYGHVGGVPVFRRADRVRHARTYYQ